MVCFQYNIAKHVKIKTVIFGDTFIIVLFKNRRSFEMSRFLTNDSTYLTNLFITDSYTEREDADIEP